MTKHVKYFRAFNGKEAFDEELTRNARDYVGRHRRPPSCLHWDEGMVIWNFATELFDRVTLKSNHPLQRGTVMSWSVEEAEDEETEWRVGREL